MRRVLRSTLALAEAYLVLAGSTAALEEVVMDKGYHDNRLLADLRAEGIRTYLPERRQKNRCWTNKPAEYEKAFRANRRRVRGAKGRQLNRWRSERCERTFAHVCETGGGRRTWLRGQMNVNKTHTFKCAAYLPLTLTLAPGERGQHRMLFCISNVLCTTSAGYLRKCHRLPKRFRKHQQRRTILPFPKGEGRGEGEEDSQPC